MMNADYISYESLVAAREAADWAFWSMIGTWLSALATLFAAIIAVLAIRSWRKHEEALELKEFRVSAYNYNVALIRAPLYNSDDLSEHDFVAVQKTYFALNEFFVSTVRMHEKIARGKASLVYQKMANIQSRYIAGDITNQQADKEVLKIRTHDPLLGIGLKEEQ
ncbi:TPA: hypothetical protein L9U77_005054 [Klebsiella pneumoniae]|nr:hypothetical protein [Klebsiella pneumoniae]